MRLRALLHLFTTSSSSSSCFSDPQHSHPEVSCRSLWLHIRISPNSRCDFVEIAWKKLSWLLLLNLVFNWLRLLLKDMPWIIWKSHECQLSYYVWLSENIILILKNLYSRFLTFGLQGCCTEVKGFLLFNRVKWGGQGLPRRRGREEKVVRKTWQEEKAELNTLQLKFSTPPR